MFQSLDWVERLSDIGIPPEEAQFLEFQSLDWVERLSDAGAALRCQPGDGFNPSTGLSVFQTQQTGCSPGRQPCFNPSTGLSVFQTQAGRVEPATDVHVSIPRLG